MNVVAGLAPPDDPDLRRVRPGAAVGTSGHPHVQVETGQSPAAQFILHHAQHVRRDPFRLGQGLPTGGEGGAGHGQAAHRGEIARQRNAVTTEDSFDGRALGFVDAGEQDVLARRDPQVGPVPLDHLGQRGAPRSRHSPTGHRHAEEPPPVVLTVPSQVVVGLPGRQLGSRGQASAEAGLDLAAEGGDADVLQHVLQPRPLAILPVSQVAIGQDDGLSQILDVLGRDPSEKVSQTREGVVGPGVGGAEPATDQHREPVGSVGAGDRDEAEVVAEDVGAAIAGPRQADLELAREVRGAVERFQVGGRLRLGGRQGGLAVDPDLVIRPRAGAEPHGQPLGEIEQHLLATVGQGCRAGDDVAHDVSAGGQRGDEVLVEAADERRQTFLAGEVELDPAARGQPEGAVGDGVGQTVDGQPLRRAERAAGNAGAHHEDVVGLVS